MAILFHCPYCTASIKVPDSTAGKLGECPKCATKIRIPTVEVPPAAAPVVPVAPSMMGTPVMPPQTTGAESFDYSRLDPIAPPKPAISRPARTKSRGGGRLVGVGLMVVLLALVGVGGWLLFSNQPIYFAAVTGTHAPSSQGISVSVPWATINVEQPRQPPVIDYFKRHQTAILSNILKIEIAASLNGLEIRAIPVEGSELVGVDPHANPDLNAFIAANEAAWDAGRREVLAKYGKNLCDNVLEAQLKGDKVANISDYRDVVALNSLVRGLGRHVLAGSAGKLYPCVFEDKDGKLYFVVPVGTRELKITEKSFEGQPTVLPPQFRLDVSVAPPAAGLTPLAPAAEDPAETPKTEEEAKPVEATANELESKPASTEDAKPEEMKKPE